MVNFHVFSHFLYHLMAEKISAPVLCLIRLSELFLLLIRFLNTGHTQESMFSFLWTLADSSFSRLLFSVNMKKDRTQLRSQGSFHERHRWPWHHEKSSWRVSICMGLQLASLRATKALLLRWFPHNIRAIMAKIKLPKKPLSMVIFWIKVKRYYQDLSSHADPARENWPWSYPYFS